MCAVLCHLSCAVCVSFVLYLVLCSLADKALQCDVLLLWGPANDHSVGQYYVCAQWHSCYVHWACLDMRVTLLETVGPVAHEPLTGSGAQ